MKYKVMKYECIPHKMDLIKPHIFTPRVGQQRRERVKELETKITAIQRENKEQAKLLKMKETTAKDSQRLAHEIKDLKKQRVNLMKQMKAESEASRKWKQMKEKEVMQLKAKVNRSCCFFRTTHWLFRVPTQVLQSLMKSYI